MEEEEATVAGELLIPDDRLRFDALRSLDASIRYQADFVRGTVDEIRDVVLAAELWDGALRLLPTSITGPTGSQLSARLTLLPLADGDELDAHISADGLEVLGAFTEGVEEVPTVDFDLDLKGAGTTPHALVAAADGVLIVTVNPGYLEGRILDVLGGAVHRLIL